VESQEWSWFVHYLVFAWLRKLMSNYRNGISHATCFDHLLRTVLIVNSRHALLVQHLSTLTLLLHGLLALIKLHIEISNREAVSSYDDLIGALQCLDRLNDGLNRLKSKVRSSFGS
jgi:hypothetical protein